MQTIKTKYKNNEKNKKARKGDKWLWVSAHRVDRNSSKVALLFTAHNVTFAQSSVLNYNAHVHA